MPRESRAAVAVLGQPWTRLLHVCNEWIRSHPAAEEWQTTMPASERLSFELGAFLHAPESRAMEPWEYDATPLHSCAIASTGVDGEHFNVLLDAECRGVIVLTAPMAFERPNVVVGQTVVDFLGLAVVSGLATIPSVAYEGFGFGAAGIVEAEPSPLLLALRDELGAEPWADIEGRLRELETQYLDLVRPRRP